MRRRNSGGAQVANPIAKPGATRTDTRNASWPATSARPSASMHLACSLIALAAGGALCLAGDSALAAAALPPGTVPTRGNYLGGTGVGDITTVNTPTGRWTTIAQTQRAAIANFNRFNIAGGSGVTVDQADTGYRLLARIFDNDPTVIQGVLQARGQVYLLNRNGILFDKGAQINVNTLVASSLNIKDDDFLKGFDGASSGVKNFTRFDLFTDPATGKPLPSGAVQVAGGANLTASSNGAIVLIAPAIANNGVIVAPDGQVILAAGRTVYLWQRNTESGEANAGSSRGLMVEVTAGKDDINLSKLVLPTNSVTNTGTVSADRGNVSIAALAINQNGIVSAGSSVVSNGSVWLTARSVADPGAQATKMAADDDNEGHRNVDRLGTVQFGAGSFTGTPLLDDSGRLSHSDSYSAFTTTNANGSTTTRDFRSWVHVVGNKIDNAGTIQARGGVIELSARGQDARVLLENGSVLDASGDWVGKSMSDNVIDIPRLTSNELKDAPWQRGGPLLGQAVSVDARKGSPLFDVSGYVANRAETVREKATVGGSITIEARQGDVVSAAGSVIDVSGGGIRHAGGTYTTTRLVGEDGKIHDIGTASPLLRYVGTTKAISRVYDKAGPMGWHQTKTWATRYDTAPTYESAYVEGASAGSLSVVAPNIVRLGDWRGGVTLGRYQVGQTDAARLPQGGTLTIGDPTSVTGVSAVVNAIAFGATPDLPANFNLATALPDSFARSVVLPADEASLAGPQAETYAYSGFGKLALYADKSITVPAGVQVSLPPGGTLVARTQKNTGSNITLEGARDGLAAGSISAPAGSVSLGSNEVVFGSSGVAADGRDLAGATIDASGMVAAEGRHVAGLPAAGGFTARAGASLSDYLVKNVAALVDDQAHASGRPAGAVMAPRFAINGADLSLDIDASNVTIGEGTRLAAMGGFLVGADNSIAAGKGGVMTLSYTGAGGTGIRGVGGVGGVQLYGYSLAKGAKLIVDSSQSARVGDFATGPSYLAADKATGDLLVAPRFFAKGGFSDYTLQSSGKTLAIAKGVTVAPAAEGLQVKLTSLARAWNASSAGLDQSPASDGDAGIRMRVAAGAGDSAVAADLAVRDKPAGERAPTSVHFVLSGAQGETLSLGERAVVRAEPGATVEFKGQGLSAGATMDLLGRVLAPGGTISASLGVKELNNTDPRFDPAHPDAETQSGLLHVGRDAMLSTAATFVPLAGGANAFGPMLAADGSVTLAPRRQGYLTSGGGISLAGTNARVVADPGSLLDASAASATVDLPTNKVGGPYAATPIWSDAGGITIASTEASRLDGSLRAKAAGLGLGGTFSLSFTRHKVGNLETQRQDFAHRIVVGQGKPDGGERLAPDGKPFVTARVAADTLNAAGFANTTLKSDNSIEFSGPVQLATTQGLTLDAPILDIKEGGGGSSGQTSSVRLSADHLTLTNTSGGDPWAFAEAATPVPRVATRTGNGTLTGQARLIDLMGSVTVNGVRGGANAATGEENPGLVLTSSGDIRLTGLPVKKGSDPAVAVDSLEGRLTTEGNIMLSAQQVYATTLSQYAIASQKVADANPAQPGQNQTISNSGTIRIAQAPGTPQPVLSAGSALSLNGARIVQGGTLKAPMGRIEMSGKEVDFEAGSMTSVSLDGLTVPLGETVDGRTWFYDLKPATAGSQMTTYTPGYAQTLSAPGDKQIVVRGDSVAVKQGATIDLAGGGNVQAFEFVAGPGGSRDVLQTSSAAPTWAILPSMRLADAPVDTHLAARNGASPAPRSGYNTLYISGVEGLADGYYPLLDAHYATLPGAYQVSALTAANRTQLAGLAATTYKNQLASSGLADQLKALAQGAANGKNLPLGQDVPTGKVGTLLDGTTVISAWRGVAGTNIREARTSGYLVRSGEDAKRYSQINLTNGDFFARQAQAAGVAPPRMPTDAGGLTLAPSGDLTLAGSLRAKPAAGGLAAEVNIAADLLAVVDRPGDAATEQALAAQAADLPAGSKFVEISADSLAGIEGSVLLGGSRTSTGTLATSARRVVVANNAGSPLRAAEIMLAAKDKVTVMAGAAIQADQAGATARDTYTTQGDGALLRASSGGQLALQRTGAKMTSGNLDIQAGASVTGNAILADATGTTRIDGTLALGKTKDGIRSGGSLAVSARSVALGETAGHDARGGLVLDNTKLATLNSLDELAIRSYSSIDLVGNAVVGSGALGQLTLDAREIAGFRPATSGSPFNQARLTATTVTLRNSGGATLATARPNGRGILDIEADRVVLGEGDKGIRGFKRVNIAAARELAQSGKGTTTLAAATSVTTPRVVGSSGADQTLRATSYDGGAQYVLDIARGAAPAGHAGTAATPGGRWAFEGKSVSFASSLDAPAGVATMAATGSDAGDGVTIKSGAAINVGGYAKQFTDAAAYASAGNISLSADNGDVRVEGGAVLDVSAAPDGGDAGRISATAAKGTVDIAGEVRGSAAHGAQGSIAVDGATIADFGGLNERLNAGGMTGEREFRQRTGDIDIAAGTTVRARHVAIAADAGSINVGGVIDAAGDKGGGRVELHAQQDLNLNDGSLIDARGTGIGTQAGDPQSSGGTVELVARDGKLDFATGATVDISAGAKGDAGTVTFAAARDAAGNWAKTPVLAGTVRAMHAPGYAGPRVLLRGDRRHDFATDFNAGIDPDAANNDPASTANFTGTNVYAEYAAFANNADNIRNAALSTLKLALPAGDLPAKAVAVGAGIELAGTNIELNSALDLTDYPATTNWLTNGVSGMFTLRAAGNLDIGNTLGLPDYTGSSADGSIPVAMDWLPKGQSWSLRLVGGADLAAANPLALLARKNLGAGTGNVTLRDDGSGTGVGKVRTGTGSIEIAAGRDFVIGGANGDRAVVYSAGTAQESDDPYARYTSGGGDIRIRAQGDVVGPLKTTTNAATAEGEFVNDWLRRTSMYDASFVPTMSATPASWWAWRPLFRQGIASFGGGNITVDAGGNIRDMGVMSPTSGRGAVEPDPYSTPIAAPLKVRGGGDVTVTAGNNMEGGEVLVGLGRGTVRAGGDVGTGSARTAVFVMGQGSDPGHDTASIRLEAGGDIKLQNISNPTILASSGPENGGFETYWNGVAIPEYGFGAARTGFFTYAPDSTAEVISVGGNIDLGRSIAAKPDGQGGLVPADGSSVAPPRLFVAALGGDIGQGVSADRKTNVPIDLYPSSQGSLNLLAAGNITNASVRDIDMLPGDLPAWNKPAGAANAKAPGAFGNFFNYGYAGSRIAKTTGGNAGPRFVVEAAAGDVTGATIITPAETTVRAGRDIKGGLFELQNLSGDDVSVIAAGRDIVQDARYYQGDVTATNSRTTALRVYFAGPGAGVVQAGRNIDLADSKGIVADGNSRNASLPSSTSARIAVLAGMRGHVEPSGVDALMAAVKLFGLMEDGHSAAMAREARDAIAAASAGKATTLDGLDTTLARLADSGGTKDIRAAAAAARDALAAARGADVKSGRADIVSSLLAGLGKMSEVDTKDGGAVNASAAAATQEFAQTVFARNVSGPGTIDLAKTQILTTGGSDIALLAPGFGASGKAAGIVNVGLPSGSGGNGNIGVVTQAGGAINAYVTGDFNVNQSKVLTSQGGDIMLYSAEGGIDAGRGALTSRSSSPPRKVAVYDPKTGEFVGYVFLPPVDVAGSGIRTVTSDPDGPGPLAAPKPGSVFLFAPKGTINAGEAGIDSAGNVTLRAVQVLNANAISAAGGSSGVPTATVSPVGTLAAAPSPTAGMHDDIMKNLPPPSYGTNASNKPRILLVEVLGLGDADDKRPEKRDE